MSEREVSDWPRMFGPTGDSRSPEVWIDTDWPVSGPPVVWSKQIGSGYSSPVISQSRLVLLHRIEDWELATCFDTETGERLWETAWPATYRCFFPYSSGPYCTPIIDDERVYLIGAAEQVLCLSLEDGSRIWTRDLETDYAPRPLAFGFGATPLLDDGRLIINLGGQKEESGIIALDAETGQTVWTSTKEIASYCTPVVTSIQGKRFVLVLAQTNLLCLSPETGEVYWRERFGIRNSQERVNAVSPLLVEEDQVLVTSGPGPGAMLIQFSADGTHEVLWKTRRKGLEAQYTNLWRDDNLIFGFSPLTSSELRCIDVSSGEQLWAWHHDHQVRRSMTVQVGQRIIALGQEGHLYVFTANRKGVELLNWVEEPVLARDCFTQPVLSHGLLYLRNEGTLRCCSLRPSDAITDETTAVRE